MAVSIKEAARRVMRRGNAAAAGQAADLAGLADEIQAEWFDYAKRVGGAKDVREMQASRSAMWQGAVDREDLVLLCALPRLDMTGWHQFAREVMARLSDFDRPLAAPDDATTYALMVLARRPSLSYTRTVPGVVWAETEGVEVPIGAVAAFALDWLAHYERKRGEAVRAAEARARQAVVVERDAARALGVLTEAGTWSRLVRHDPPTVAWWKRDAWGWLGHELGVGNGSSVLIALGKKLEEERANGRG